MRICIVYDCLFPYTVGGGERWYRTLALRLAAEGHDVTYLTMRQWERGETPDLPGVRVRVAAPRMALYSGPGQRRMLPPLVFGLGVLVHLLLHGRRYDVVHCASFPYFSLLAAAAVRPLHRYGLIVDWIELWTREYWRAYLGPVGGRVGWAIQRLCVRATPRGFSFAETTRERMRALGHRGEITVLRGLHRGALEPVEAQPAQPLVICAGRHIPEKQMPAAVEAIALARRRLPDLRGIVFGDGPERPRVLEAIERHGLTGVVEAPGFVPQEELDSALPSALCLLHPSTREGYGLVVVESAALGVPTILAAHPDNAATELVEPGVNGIIAPSADPQALADAIVAVHEAGPALRQSTTEWFRRNAHDVSVDASLDTVAAAYGSARS